MLLIFRLKPGVEKKSKTCLNGRFITIWPFMTDLPSISISWTVSFPSLFNFQSFLFSKDLMYSIASSAPFSTSMSCWVRGPCWTATCYFFFPEMLISIRIYKFYIIHNKIASTKYVETSNVKIYYSKQSGYVVIFYLFILIQIIYNESRRLWFLLFWRLRK